MAHPRHSPRRRDFLRRVPLSGLAVLGALPLAGAIAGCGLGAAARTDFHVLRDAGADAAAAPGPRIDQVLMLAAVAMPGLYDSDRMVFSADGRSRSYFQFGYWSERPAQALQLLAEARLVRAQRFREVVLSTSGVRGDLLLTLRLDELYLDASVDPGQVRLVVSAELLDWRSRKLLGRRIFRQATEASPADAGGVAQAASKAVAVVLGELVDFAAASAAAAAA
jgi:cholesterol transport system auxiliary component